MAKVGFITGGASGMGLAVARLLAQKNWTLAIGDLNTKAGEQVADELGATFYKTNVADYDQLAQTFSQIWDKHGRLDFVFANAGIMERFDFFARHDDVSIPAAPDLSVIDVNVKGAVNSAYLAQHFFRKNTHVKGGCLVITASAGGLYPTPSIPVYSATKHATVGLMRSIAHTAHARDNIRVNCLCPGTVATGILTKEEYGQLPPEIFTPLEKITGVVWNMIEDESLVGQAVEVAVNNVYYRDLPFVEDEMLRKTIASLSSDGMNLK